MVALLVRLIVVAAIRISVARVLVRTRLAMIYRS